MNDKINPLITERLEDVAEVNEYLHNTTLILKRITIETINTFNEGNKLILFGNGGSAADAQHIAAELSGRYYLDRKSLPAIALTTNTSSLTAISNDYDFNEVFAKQLEGFGETGDLAIGISTSGTSENVVRGIIKANNLELTTIGLTGKTGGKLPDITDYCLKVPSNDTPRIQEAHITVWHIICEIVEKELFGQCYKDE